MNEYLQVASRIIEAGKRRFMPSPSDWRIDKIGDITVSVSVDDVVSGGATAVVPVNVDAKAGTLGIVASSSVQTVHISGQGAGASVGLGWQAPFVSMAGSGLPKMAKEAAVSGGISGGKEVLLPDMPSGSVGSLWTGPSAGGVLSPRDFEGVATVSKLEANFGPNGISFGVIFFAPRAIVGPLDLATVRAFGLVASIEWCLEITAGAGSMAYSTTVTLPGATTGDPSAAQRQAGTTA